MSNRWYCSASLMLWLVVPHLVHGGFFTVQNCTPTFLFVAQMRTKARTDDKKAYFDSAWEKEQVMVKALPPLASIAIMADTASGYATYNRVLWVSNNLKELERAIRTGDRIGTQVDSLYIGGKQSGVKYIARLGGNKFMLAPTKEEALKKILPIKEAELEAAAQAVLGSLTNSEYNNLYMRIDKDLAAQEQVRFYNANKAILKALKNSTYP